MGAISIERLYKALAVSLLAFLLMPACSQPPKAPEGVLDTPAHHVASGFKFLQKNYNADAKREFDLALQLDPYYSAAHRGLGLVYGKANEFDSAFQAMNRARDDASSGEQRAMAYVGFMRIYTMQEKAGWLEQVEDRFKDALRWKSDFPQAYFYMGIAYKNAGRIGDATKSFNRVLKLNQGLVAEARKQLAEMNNPK